MSSGFESGELNEWVKAIWLEINLWKFHFAV